MTADVSAGAKSSYGTLTRVSLRFRDDELERQFRHAIWPTQTQNIRISIALGAVAFFVAVLVEFFRAPDGLALAWLAGSHVGVFAICAAIYYYSYRPEPVSKLPWLLLALAAALSVASAIVVGTGAIPWREYAVTEALGIVFFSVVLANWMPQIYLSVGILLVGYVAALPTGEFGIGAVQIVVAEAFIAAAGLFVVRRISIQDRLWFLKGERLSQSRDETLEELGEARFHRDACEKSAAESISLMEELELMREDLEDQTVFLTSVLDNISQGVGVFDADFGLAAWNNSFGEVQELPDELLHPGLSLEDVVTHNIGRTGKEGKQLQIEVGATIALFLNTAKGDQHSCVYERVRSDGAVFEVQGNPMPGGGLVITYTDITEQKKAEAVMRQMAETDALTGLANRAAFDSALALALASADTSGGVERDRTALAMLDLDGFKPVNDTYGHPVGDKLLCQVAEVIQSSVRETDFAARLGGDEFAIIYKMVGSADDVRVPLQRLIQRLEVPFIIDGHRIKTGISVGLARFPDDADNGEDLVMRADQALYEAKRAGKGQLKVVLG